MIGGRMKVSKHTVRNTRILRFAILPTVMAAVLGAMVGLPRDRANAATTKKVKELYKRPAPNFDLNASRNLPNIRQATQAQLSALDNLKSSVNSPNMTT